MPDKLRMEELEERIAPTVVDAGDVLQWTDTNGDVITIYYDGPDGSSYEILDTLGGDIGNGDNIGTIEFSGADVSSEMYILGDNGGGSDIVISESISAPGQDIGIIDIGIADQGEDAGTVLLGNNFAVAVGGWLGQIFINGDFDSDTGGHSIVAGDDIGTIYINGNLHLHAGTEIADFAAGGALGAGNIHFLVVNGDTYIGSGTGTELPSQAFTTTAQVFDDAGDGTEVAINIALSAAAPVGEYWAVDVVGGGSVLLEIDVVSANSKLTLSSTGAGADVVNVWFAEDASGLYVTGAADFDVLSVAAEGSVGAISNKTIGGDLGVIIAAGDVGLIQTARYGHLGMMGTGYTNSISVFDSYYVIGYGVEVDGLITKIQADSIRNIDIVAGDIGTVIAKASIRDVNIMSGLDIDSVTTGSMYYSELIAEGMISKVSIGAGGLFESDILASEIGTVAVKGVINDALISAQYEDGGSQTGGPIGSVAANAIIDSHINALGDIGKVAVKGAFWDSTVDTSFWDSNLSTTLGGSVVSFSAAGMNDSSVESLGAITSVKIGKGGMLANSGIYSNAGMSTFIVAGDVHDSVIQIDGDISTFKVAGTFAGGSQLDAGNVTTLNVSGAMYNTIINVTSASRVVIGAMYGDDVRFNADSVGTMNVNGAVSSDGGTVVDIDAYTSFSVKGDINDCSFTLRDGEKIALNGSVFYLSLNAVDIASLTTRFTSALTLTVDNDLDSMKVNGSFIYGEISVDGEAGPISVNGTVLNSSIDLHGSTAAGVAVKGDFVRSYLTLGVNGGTATDTGYFNVNGSIIHAGLDIYGPLAALAVKQDVINVEVEATGAIGRVAIGKSIIASDVDSASTFGPLTVGGNLYDAAIATEGDLGDITVKGNMLGFYIAAEDYDGGGHPIAVNMGNVTATKIFDGEIKATGNVGMITAKTNIVDLYLCSLESDNNGSGPDIGGGNITGIKADGLMNVDVEAWGSIGRITLGASGMDDSTEITTEVGDFAGLTTKGYVFGYIQIGGDLTGSVLTGGLDALEYNGAYLFLDSNGTMTDGALVVAGDVPDGTIIS